MNPGEWEVDDRIADWFVWPEELKEGNLYGVAACATRPVLDEAGEVVLDDEGEIVVEYAPSGARLMVVREIGGRRAFMQLTVSRGLVERARFDWAAIFRDQFNRGFARMARREAEEA